VKYDQGPIESVASSVRAAKDSWLRVSAMVAVLWAVWCGAEWAAYAVTGGVDAGVTLLGTVVAVVTSAVYMYLYAITVSAWVQLDNAR